LACGAKMRLMQMEQRGNPTSEVAFERHTFKCSACPQISQRLVFSRPRSSNTDLRVAPPPSNPASADLQMRRLANANALAKVAENLRSRRRRISIEARAAAPEGYEKPQNQNAPVQERNDRPPEPRKTWSWADAVEKVTASLKTAASAQAAFLLLEAGHAQRRPVNEMLPAAQFPAERRSRGTS
jgi:hypothetical protein